jgi:hypothetical protein
VRKGCDLVYSLISCCACILSSGSYIIMSRPEDTIALVARWYEENMRRPVETKGRRPAEKRLAQKWHALLKHKSSLLTSVLVEAETLDEKFQTCDVNILATWMNEYKRCPKRGRGGDEDKLARQWKQLLNTANDLPPKVKGVVMKLRCRLLTDPAWIEAEKAEEALATAPQLVACETVKAWMDLHKRHPRCGRVGCEGGMARKWRHLRSLPRSSIRPDVFASVGELKRCMSTDPVWIEAEKTEDALVKAHSARKRSRGS